jgi:hypothetical protein
MKSKAELRRSFPLWLREAFFHTRLPGVEFPEPNDLEEARIMLGERVVDWTQQWKQEGRQEGRQKGEAFIAVYGFGASGRCRRGRRRGWRKRPWNSWRPGGIGC